MINITVLWLLLLPLVLSAIMVFAIPRYFQGQFDIKAACIFGVVSFIVSAAILLAMFYFSVGSKISDVEIWNSQVTSKKREHDSYKRSYECNCKAVTKCTGSRNRSCTTETVCDTCYENRYTVTWRCYSDIGEWIIDSLDSGSRSVYNESDPARFTKINVGDPVAKKASYTNYIKGVPESLFRPAAKSLKEQFAGQIPEYPINIYDFYKIDRVIPVGVNIPNLNEWNVALSKILRTLGPQKQANVVIVITKTNDPNYYYALQDAWLNGKKNDIVLVIGAPEFPKKATWVNVMALTQENIFQVRLRDEILSLEELTADNVISAVNKITTESFKRKRMRDFKYLENEIDPPTWVLVTTVFLILVVYAGTLFYVRHQVLSNAYPRYNRFKR